MDHEKLFRKESLERLSSPERLDQLMQLVNPRDWLPLASLGVFVFLALVWSIFGRIPITENAPGVLIRPKRVVHFQSPISGQLKSVNVKSGECVEKNRILATINPSGLKQQLQQQRAKRSELMAQASDSGSLQRQRSKLEKEALISERASIQQRLQAAKALNPVLKNQGLAAIAQQRQTLQQRLRTAQALIPALKNKASSAIAQQRISIQQRLSDARALIPIQKERLEKRKKLLQEGAIPKDALLEVQQQYRQAQQEIAALQAELKGLDFNETETQQQYLANLNSISDIQDKKIQ
ncbi:MAG: biotin/lipoyl-binding protein [Cyanobacteria bacterium J06628_3]